MVLCPTKAAAQTAANTVNKANGPSTGTSWEQQIGAFFSALESKNTWLRAAKGVVGGVMVIVGLANITGASEVVGDAVKKAPAGFGMW